MVIGLGLECYNLLLVPTGNEIMFDDELLVVNGTNKLNFGEVSSLIASFPFVKPYTPKDMSQGSDPECYFVFADGSCIIEIEIDAGSIEANRVVEEISIRFAVTNPIDTFQKALQICEGVSIKLNMQIIDMRLKAVIDLANDLVLAKSKKAFEEKRVRFYKMYNLPIDTWAKPMHCGKALFDELRNQ
ncbi:hypothetical protein D3C76_147910 [compost metagenome]